MKTRHFFLLALIAVIAASCSLSTQDSTLITEKIQYDVLIASPDASYDWWIQNIPNPTREKFVKHIMDKATSGEVQAYDYYDNPLTAEEVKAIGVDTLFMTLRRVVEPYEEYDTLVINRIELTDINRIRFLEEWKWDENTLEIEKTVIAIAPVAEKYNTYGNFVGLHPLFWIKINDLQEEK